MSWIVHAIGCEYKIKRLSDVLAHGGVVLLVDELTLRPPGHVRWESRPVKLGNLDPVVFSLHLGRDHAARCRRHARREVEVHADLEIGEYIMVIIRRDDQAGVLVALDLGTRHT